MRSLVLYYTRTGKTRFVAELIANELKSDIEQIVERKDRSGWFGFALSIVDALRRSGSRIDALKNKPLEYDLIVIGQPVWASLPVPAVRELSRHYRLADKQIALFCTLDGTTPGDCLVQTAKLFPGAKVSVTKAFIKPMADEDKAKKDARKFCERLLA
jgi:flavodoxin